MNRRTQMVEGGKDIARAVAFLSRIPMPASLFENESHSAAARQAWAYPLAGLVIGFPAALLMVLIGYAASPLLTAVLAIATTTVLTGALHEDGLADVADGFWGGWTKQRRLEIMKDSTVGAYGVLGLVIWFALVTTALSDIIATNGALAAALLWLVICAASRAAMTFLWATTPPARNDGVAHGAGQPDNRAAAVAAGCASAIALIAIAFGASFWLIAALLIAASSTVAMRALCLRKIEGHTGDTLGAVQKIAEIAALTSLAIMV